MLHRRALRRAADKEMPMTRSAPATTRAPDRAAGETAPGRRWIALGVATALSFAPLAATAQDDAATDEDIIVSHGFSTFGDLKYAADFPHFDYVNPDAPKGGEISIPAEGTFDSLNPYSTLRGTPGLLSTIMYERILTSADDEVSGSYCLLCTTMEYPESQDWVIFNLRPEARFSDGTPVTAHDIVFSHKLLLEQGTPSYASYVSQVIPQVEALDDHRVKFTFAEGIPRKNLITQAGSTPAWSQAWYESTGARLDESRLQVSPGSGPYMLDSFDVGRRIVYRRNPDYWGADLPAMQGMANFDRIRVEYFADSNAALLGFSAGEYTFRQENSSLNWATSYNFPAVGRGWVVRAELPNGNLPSATGFVFNLRRDKLQDRNVRLALGRVFNFTFTNETLQYGLFQQRESFWQGSDLQARDLPEGLELEYLQSVADLLDPAILTEPALLPHESSARQLDRRNLGEALDLMAAAGYTPGNDGILRNEAGQPLRIEFLETRQSFDRIITPYIENLRQLGVDARYTRVDPAQYQARTQSFDYDIIYDGYRVGLEEGIGLSQRFGSEDRDDVFNPAGYGNEAVDRIIDRVVEATTYEEMAAGVRAIGRRGGLPPEFIAQLEREFGFDKPPVERFLNMMWNYLRFDFGESYFRSISVIDLVIEKMPVSISLGLWSTLIAYLISIPLGIRKAVRDGTRFDTWTSRRHHRRLRDPGLPVRDPAARAVRRRLLLADLPAARPDLGQLGAARWPARSSTTSGTSRCRSSPDHRRFATLTLLTKNSLPRRDQASST
jgi:microcin C transport system substrate-binding protein